MADPVRRSDSMIAPQHVLREALDAMEVLSKAVPK